MTTGDYRPPRGVGYQPAPMNRPPAQPLSVGVQPGTLNIVRARVVIVFGTTGGIFLYNGTPGPGNPPVMWAVPPGVTADPSGNAVSPVLGVGTPGGPQTLIDQSGNILLTGSAGTSLSLMPSANLPFSLTTTITGIMQSLMNLGSGDVSQTQAGVVSGIKLGTSSSAKMGTLIVSPYGTTGTGILLQAQNDGATDVASIVFGTTATQAGAIVFTPTYAILPGTLIGYTGGGAITVVTRTSGSGTIPIPVGVTTGVGESWGHGGNGGSGGSGGGGGGGGGGEYAQEPALALTSGGTASFSVPALGAGATTLAGSAVTVTANQGATGNNGTSGGPGTGGAGGNGSTNTVHNNGGNGGNGGAAGGGGGGASGGSGGAGGNGFHGAPGASGQPGIPPSGGAGGGAGGTANHGGSAGQTPGGAGGGAGENSGVAALGQLGQVRLTYSTGAPGVMWSMNGTSAAVTDQFGTSIPVGNRVNLPDTNSYRTERIIQQVSPRSQSFSSTTPAAIAGLSLPVGIGTYIVRARFIIEWNAAAGQSQMRFTGPSINQYDVSFKDQQSGTTSTTNNANTVASGTASGTGYNTTLINITGTMTGAGVFHDVDVWAMFNFSAAGTLQLQAASSVATDAWLVVSGFWEMQPL